MRNEAREGAGKSHKRRSERTKGVSLMGWYVTDQPNAKVESKCLRG